MPLYALQSRRTTPITLIITICTTVPVFLFLVFLFNRVPSYSPSLGPDDKSTVFNVNWTNSIRASRTAYVYTYFSGRTDDTQRYVSTLVSIEALRRTNTNRDIVVMIDSFASENQIQGFKDHGARVHSIPKIDQFAYKSDSFALTERCYSNFAPMFAWSLDDLYDRVIWLDADVLPQLNMDELFLCGKFCLPYSNTEWYSTSLYVIQPDMMAFITMYGQLAENDDLLDKLKHPQFSSMASMLTLIPDFSDCQNAFETLLFSAYPGIETAPLFDAESSTGQQDISMMRLPLGYCMDPLYWYPFYNWNIARTAPYKRFSSNTEYDIPGHSLGFGIHKPYDWIQAIYFNTHWVWAHWRQVTLNEVYSGLIWAVLLFHIAVYCGCVYGTPWVLRWAVGANKSRRARQKLQQHQQQRGSHNDDFTNSVTLDGLQPIEQQDINITASTTSSTLEPPNEDATTDGSNEFDTEVMQQKALANQQSRLSFKIVSFLFTIGTYIGSATIGLLIGLVCCYFALLFAMIVIPSHTPFYIAWPLFALTSALSQQMVLYMIATIFYLSVNGVDAWIQSTDYIQAIEAQLVSDQRMQQRVPPPKPTIEIGHQLYQKFDPDFINEHAKLAPLDPYQAILFFVDERTQTLSAIAQTLLISRLVQYKSLLFNICIVGLTFFLMQFDFYPNFVVKLFVLFFLFLFIITVFVRPYQHLMIILHFAYGGHRTWRRIKRMHM